VKAIFRPNDIEEFKPSRVLIIGNGALENGWKPMISAVRKSELFSHLSKLQNEELEKIVSILIAQTIHEYNIMRGVVLERVVPGTTLENIQTIKSYFREFENFLLNIEKEYNIELKIRPQIVMIEKMITENTGTITLNYDNSIWEYRNGGDYIFKYLIHIHGRAASHESLYFPTDNTFQDNVSLVIQTIKSTCIKKKAISEIKKSTVGLLGNEVVYLDRRNIDVTNMINKAHRTAIDWLSSANEIVFWGIGLNEFDSELLSILNRSILGNKKEDRKLKVINTNCNVAEKTKIYLGIQDKNYEFINPKTL
jgi:hypothetical protein